MSAIKKYEDFLAQLDWEEMSLGEKEALYEATYGAPNEEGIPFRVITDGDRDSDVIIEHHLNDAKLVLRYSELKDFRHWLENEYMDGEMGTSYFPFEEEKEKDNEREYRVSRFSYELEQVVLSQLKRYFSPYTIGQDVSIDLNGFVYKADFVVYDNHDKIRVIIEVKQFDYISPKTFNEVFGSIIRRISNVHLLLTDGKSTVYKEPNKQPISIPLFGIALGIIVSRINRANVESNKSDAKELCIKAIQKTKTRRIKDNKVKQEKLLEFFNTLKAEDFQSKNQDIFNLTEDKEYEFFRVLLGAQTPPRNIVKFASVRSLYSILDKERFCMNSLVCMNDPSEKDYADIFLNKQKTVDNSRETFIVSACAEEKEKDLTIWRLYGDDTNGICINFAVNASKLNNNGFYLAPISYAKDEKHHFELEIIKNIQRAFQRKGWKFVIKDWDIWKHFFKKQIYAIEEEKRLIYVPQKDTSSIKPESEWFTDDRTGIYSEAKKFNLTTNNAFPLTINKIILGTKFRAKDDNVKQFELRLKKTHVLTANSNKDDVFVKSTIEDYR